MSNWDNRVRQAVVWLAAQDIMPAAMGDPVDAIERAKKDEPEHQKLAALLTAAHATMQDGRWRVADLIKASEQAVSAPVTCPEPVAALRDVIDEIAGEHGKINPRKLGRWIEKQAERRCTGMWIERDGVKWKTALWRVRGEPKAEG
jgi:hypothetical protein